MTLQATLNTLKTKIAGKRIFVTKNTSAEKGIIFCTPTQLIRRISEDPSVIGSSRFILDEFHTRTVMLDVLFALLLKHKSAFREPFQLVMMSATPDPAIINALKNSQTL